MSLMKKKYEIIKDSPKAMEWGEYKKIIKPEWNKLLNEDSPKDEKYYQSFLEQHPSMLPFAFGYGGTSGHYPFPGAVISQPKLPDYTKKVPDFMWIACDSIFIYPILIEIESPHKKWFTKEEQPRAEFTQAMNQLIDWKIWFSNGLNLEKFKEYYELSSDFFRSRTFKPTYVLIYGRRSEAKQSLHSSKKRAHINDSDIHLMTYDRLEPQADNSQFLTVKRKADGYYAMYIPPTVNLGPGNADYWKYIKEKEAAVDSSMYINPERAKFLKERFSYWDNADTGFKYTGDIE